MLKVLNSSSRKESMSAKDAVLEKLKDQRDEAILLQQVRQNPRLKGFGISEFRFRELITGSVSTKSKCMVLVAGAMESRNIGAVLKFVLAPVGAQSKLQP